MNIPIFVGVALVVAGGTLLAAGFGAFDDLAGDYRECAWHIDVPMQESAAASLRLTFNNSAGGPLRVRACAFDADGLQRVDEEFDVPESPAHVVDLKVPRGAFELVVQIDSPGGHSDVWSLVDSTACADHSVSKDYPVYLTHWDGIYSNAFDQNRMLPPDRRPPDTSTWFGVRPATCTATGAVVESERPDSEGSSFDIDLSALSGGPGLGLGGVLGVAGLMTLGLAGGPGLAFGAYGLFTRLVRPKILDQPTRSRIVDLVEQRPGIRFQEIATSLGLGQGTAMHHLQVLVAQKALSRLRHAYFVFGKYGRDDMRRTVALSTPTARAMFDALGSIQEARVVDLARRLGVTRSWATKVVKDLERAGLVRRRRQGRACFVDSV